MTAQKRLIPIDDCYIELGKRLKEIRESKGYSMEKAAKKIRMNKSSVMRLERGELSTSLTTIKKILNYYGYSFHIDIIQKNYKDKNVQIRFHTPFKLPADFKTNRYMKKKQGPAERVKQAEWKSYNWKPRK